MVDTLLLRKRSWFDMYPYKELYKGFGSPQGLTNNELELKTGGLIHNVKHVWQNTAKSNEYKKNTAV